MPSPFPGMDPYLEEPGLWPDVHHGLIAEMQAGLNSRLRPKYHVRIEARVYVSDEDDPGRRVIIPDLRIAERPGHSASPLTPAGTQGLEVAEPVETTILIDDEIHEAYLEVIDQAQRQVVTVIEVVSPTNKVANSRGRRSYRRKRREVLRSPSHWVEIDLLRAENRRSFAKSSPPVITRFMSRAQRRPGARTWPIRLQQQLPVIAIPLRPEDGDTPLDLQAVLAAAYDRGAYDMEIDYRADAVPPLSAEDAAWAHQWLHAKGLR